LTKAQSEKRKVKNAKWKAQSEKWKRKAKARFNAPLLRYFGRYPTMGSAAQPVTAGVHGVSSKKCRLEVVR